MSTLDAWLLWFGTDWHWLIVILCLAAFFVFGVVGFVIDSDGDWWIF